MTATDAQAVSAYLRRCFARLGGQARFLSSTAAADDLEGVRRALGYGRVDVYGSSYGATLAQLYLRHKNPHVRLIGIERLIGLLGSREAYDEVHAATGVTVRQISSLLEHALRENRANSVHAATEETSLLRRLRNRLSGRKS